MSDLIFLQEENWPSVDVLCVKCGAWSSHPADSDLSLVVCGSCYADQSPPEAS